MFPEILIIKEKKNLTGDLPACLNLFFILVSDFSNNNNSRHARVTSIFILVRSCWMTWEFIREMN